MSESIGQPNPEEREQIQRVIQALYDAGYTVEIIKKLLGVGDEKK